MVVYVEGDKCPLFLCGHGCVCKSILERVQHINRAHGGIVSLSQGTGFA